MSKIQEILKKKEARKIRLHHAVDSVINQIKELDPLRIILFGSLAQGEVDVNSDVDLLIIMPSTKTGKDWSKLIYETVEPKVATHFIVYNENEFKENLAASCFLQSAMKGKVIYEKAA